MKPVLKSERLDQIGIIASIACAIHCAALPMAITALPLMGLEFLADSRVEVFMICLSLVIGISALGTSYVKHKKFLPAIILIAGILMIAAGHHVMHDWESLLIPIGGLVIAAAHLLNWRLSRRCRYSADADQNTKYH